MSEKLIPTLINESIAMIPFIGFFLGIIAGYFQLRFTVNQLKTDHENKKIKDAETFKYIEDSMKGLSTKINNFKTDLNKEISDKHVELTRALSRIEGVLSVVVPRTSLKQKQQEEG